MRPTWRIEAIIAAFAIMAVDTSCAPAQMAETTPFSTASGLMPGPTDSALPTNKPTRTLEPTEMPSLTPTSTATGVASSIVLPGWVPEGARARIGRGIINQIALSPDGKTVAVAGATGLSLFTADTFQEVWSVPTTVEMSHIFFRESGQTLATISKEEYTISRSLHMSTLYYGAIQKVYIWDKADGNLIKTIPINFYARSEIGIAVSPNGMKMAISGVIDKPQKENSELQIWNLDSARRINSLDIGSYVMSLSSTGELLATTDGVDICIWNTETGEKVACWTTPGVDELAFSPDDKIIASSWGMEIHLWDAAKGIRIRRLRSEFRIMTQIAFSPDGEYLAAGTSHGDVAMWNSRTGNKIGEQLSLNNGNLKYHYLWSLAFQPNGKTLWIGLMDGIIVLDSNSAGILNSIEYPFSGWEGVRLSSNKNIIGLWKKGKIEEYNLIDYSAEESYEYPAEAFLSPDFRLYAYISKDDQIHVADTRTAKVLHTIRKPLTLEAIIFSPNGEKVALVKTGEYMEIADIWELSTGRLITTLDFPPTATNTHSWHLEFSPDGKRVALAAEGIEYGGAILVYDLTTNTLLEEFGLDGWKYFTFSFDGLKIAVECPRDLPGLRCIYNLKTKEWMMSFRYQWPEDERWLPEGLSSVSLSPGDQFLVCGTNEGRLLVWDARSRDFLFEGKGHNKEIVGISFSPDGQYFASTSADGSVVVWVVGWRLWVFQ